jgi:predicted ATP-grasp superfamily ATP-dependent carboligase
VDGFVDRAGRLNATFARRRLRMHPPDFGNSTYMVSVARDRVADAIATIQRLVERVGYRGIFSAEFKYDDRDGLFKILEVNARPWWYVEFAARCGVDVCSMAFRDALGLRAKPAGAYRVGRACVFPYYDYGACRELSRQGQLSLWEWARSWLMAEQPVFRWSDPLPAVIETSRGLGRRLVKMVSGPPHGR